MNKDEQTEFMKRVSELLKNSDSLDTDQLLNEMDKIAQDVMGEFTGLYCENCGEPIMMDQPTVTVQGLVCHAECKPKTKNELAESIKQLSKEINHLSTKIERLIQLG